MCNLGIESVFVREGIDVGLRQAFIGHEGQTSRYAKLKVLKNGSLQIAAEAAGFDVLVTVDKNLPYPQNLSGCSIAVVILEARSTTLDELLKLMPDVLSARNNLKPGPVLRMKPA